MSAGGGGGVTGDWAALDALEASLSSLGTAVPDAAQAAAAEIQTIARADYAAGRGPFGETWARRKKDGALALARPGQTVTFAAVGVEIHGEAEGILQYHQDGGPHLPVRKVFPSPGDGMPPAWEAAVEQAMGAEMVKRGIQT